MHSARKRVIQSFATKVNTALEKLQQDGTVQSIIDNYIGSEDRWERLPT